VTLLRDFNVIASDCELEQCDYVVCHELRGDWTTRQRGELLTAARDVLQRLNRSKFIRAALRLNGHDELLAVPIDSNIDLVDFNLTHFFDCGAKMTLERVCRDAEEDVYQSVVSDFGEKRLFVSQGMSRDDFRGGVGYA
jgi:hypothetical protein